MAQKISDAAGLTSTEHSSCKHSAARRAFAVMPQKPTFCIHVQEGARLCCTCGLRVACYCKIWLSRQNCCVAKAGWRGRVRRHASLTCINRRTSRSKHGECYCCETLLGY